jgi:hypothetical protein
MRLGTPFAATFVVETLLVSAGSTISHERSFAANTAPHSPSPHLRQRRSNAASHSMQNLAFSKFSQWQLGQRIHPPLGADVRCISV